MVLFKRAYKVRGFKPRTKAKKTTTKKKTDKKVATVGKVKRMLGRAKENKMVGRPVLNSQEFYSSITTIYPVMPSIAQGTADYQRIGETVQPKGLYVKGQIGCTWGSQPNNQPIVARVMLLSIKAVKNEQFIGTAWGSYAQKLLKYNDPTVSGIIELPYGTQPYSNLPPVNTDIFTVHMDKKILLTPSKTNNDVGDGVEFNAKSSRRFTAKVPTPANLHFDSQVSAWGNTATNCCPFLVIGYEYADGSPGDAPGGGGAGAPRITANAWSFLYYEDA